MKPSLVPWTFAATLVLLGSNALGLFDGSPIGTDAGTPLFLDPARVLDLARSGPFELRLPIGRVAFDLHPNPIAAGALVGLNGVPTGRVTETVTFEGTANGYPARLAATQAGVFALVLSEDPLLLEPAWLSRPGAPLDEHRVALWSQAPPQIHDEQEAPSRARGLVEPVPPQVTPTGPANRVVHFLVEEDFALYDRTSLGGQCQDCWVQVQQAVLNFAELLFERQTGVSFEITSQWACTSVAACPYVGLGAGDWLDAFRFRWETVVDEPPHELGHFLSGTNLNGFDGLAFQASVNSPDGYALSEVSAVSTGVSVSPLRYATVAHEIGHNFNATHDEADVFVPAPNQQLGFLSVTTLMGAGSLVKFQFSDGVVNPAHNNVARIVAHAQQRLPAP